MSLHFASLCLSDIEEEGELIIIILQLTHNEMSIKTSLIPLLLKFQTIFLTAEKYSADLDKKRSKLIQTITLVMPIADELRQQGLIHPETYNKIQAARTSQDQMRELYNALTTTKSKSAFYRILQEIEPQACASM